MTAQELEVGNVIRIDKKLWKITEKEISGHGKVSRTVHVKLKNLDDGGTTEKNFKTGDDIEVVDSEHVTMEYLYREDSFFVFMNTSSYEQERISKEVIGEQAIFLKENETIDALVIEGSARALVFPETVTLKVTTTPEGVKEGEKEAELENGLKVLVPHFVTESDSVVVNTEDFSYVERVTVKSMKSNAVSLKKEDKEEK